VGVCDDVGCDLAEEGIHRDGGDHEGEAVRGETELRASAGQHAAHDGDEQIEGGEIERHPREVGPDRPEHRQARPGDEGGEGGEADEVGA
jgi:hypothetical protein